MAGKVLNIKACSPLKLYRGLTGKYHAICHYFIQFIGKMGIRDEK